MGEKMKATKLRNIEALVISALGALAALYIGAKYLFPLALPFLIGWAVAFLVRPIARKIGEGLHLPTKPIRVFFALLFTVGVLSLLGFFLFRVLSEAIRLTRDLATSDAFSRLLVSLFAPLEKLFPDGALGGFEEGAKDALTSLLSTLAQSVAALFGKVAGAIPELLLFLLISVISSVYFSIDLENINQKTLKILPRRVGEWLVRFKDGFLKTAIRYLYSYLILGLITFSIMTLAFVLFGVEYALALALLVALLDALPVIGVGTVLVPWGVVRLLLGDTRLGVSLLILFVFNAILRQFIEPKIIGDSLGISPILSLVLLYVSYRVFGLFGVVLIPLFTVILRVLTDSKGKFTLKEHKPAPVE